MSRNILKRAVILAFPIAAVVGPTAAFATPHHHGSTPSGSCTGTSVPAGTTYSVDGSGLPANSMVDFFVTTANGALSSTTALTDSSGNASVSGVAYVAGTATAVINSASGSGATLATCAFQIS